ncbi:MAG: release factor glutamine methyltransferase [Thalassolituus sp.]
MSLTVADWIKQAQACLLDSGSDSHRLDAELLIMHVLQVNRAWLFTWPEKELSPDQTSQLVELLQRRAQGEPIAYLTGVREFWSLPLKVAPSTLIPRPDTETLIEWALSLTMPEHTRAVDLGTGTGAIALALASEHPTWQVSAVEFNSEAVELARENAERLGLAVKVEQGSWFEPFQGTYDLIVSNPPYIDPNDHHLDEGDVRFEPRSALVANNGGMSDLEHIIATAPQYLNANAWLLLEHGYDQADAVCDCLRQHGFVDVENRRDLGDQPRISGGRWTGDWIGHCAGKRNGGRMI